MSCHLCLRDRPLLESHIIPRFVYRWLRESSPSGFIRSSQAPNKRIQDGPTARLLCEECEGLLSGWEKQFAEQVFVPLHNGERRVLPYRDWALKFAVSVSWRVLNWPGDERRSHLTEAQRTTAASCSEVWREFLIGEREHPGAHELRLIPLDVLESHSTPSLSPFMNRYMTRVVAADVVAGRRTIITYSKLCRLLIIGFVDVPDFKRWKGGKVGVRQGTVGGPVVYELPEGVFDYMNHSANAAGAALGRMSERQADKLQSMMLEDVEALAQSEVFRAMRKDVEFSGSRAFDLRALNGVQGAAD
jgi:hypothetical protein